MAVLTDLKRVIVDKKAVLLDLDNTLYAYDPCHAYAFKMVYRFFCQHVQKITLTDFQKEYSFAQKKIHRKFKGTAFSHSRLHYFEMILRKYSSGFPALKLEKFYWNAFFEKMKLAPWVFPFLAFCKKEKKKVVIVTNLTTALQKRKIKFLNLTSKVDAMVTSEDAGIEKPDPRIFRRALKKLHAKPFEAITIGDDMKSDRVPFLDFFLVKG